MANIIHVPDTDYTTCSSSTSASTEWSSETSDSDKVKHLTARTFADLATLNSMIINLESIDPDRVLNLNTTGVLHQPTRHNYPIGRPMRGESRIKSVCRFYVEFINTPQGTTAHIQVCATAAITLFCFSTYERLTCGNDSDCRYNKMLPYFISEIFFALFAFGFGINGIRLCYKRRAQGQFD